MSIVVNGFILGAVLYTLYVLKRWDRLADQLNDKMKELFPEERDV